MNTSGYSWIPEKQKNPAWETCCGLTFRLSFWNPLDPWLAFISLFYWCSGQGSYSTALMPSNPCAWTFPALYKDENKTFSMFSLGSGLGCLLWLSIPLGCRRKFLLEHFPISLLFCFKSNNAKSKSGETQVSHNSCWSLYFQSSVVCLIQSIMGTWGCSFTTSKIF